MNSKQCCFISHLDMKYDILLILILSVVATDTFLLTINIVDYFLFPAEHGIQDLHGFMCHYEDCLIIHLCEE